MTGKSLDDRFDSGESVLQDFDLSAATRPNLTLRRVNVDFPSWMITRLDQEARRRGVSRQALIKTWLSDKLDSAA
jgi:hypothetical protein